MRVVALLCLLGLAAAATAPTSEKCLDSGVCFQYYAKASTFSQAQDECNSLDKHGKDTDKKRRRTVAAIHTDEENALVKSMIQSTTYIGGIETSTNGLYEWSDGSTWDYTYQSFGTDGLTAGHETRVAMTRDGKWHDWLKGQSRLHFMCRTGPISKPDYSDVKPKKTQCVGNTGVCYELFTRNTQWVAAQAICRSQTGRVMASIHNDAENKVVKSMISAPTYIGATELATNGDYEWTDGTHFDYLPWNDGLKSTQESRIAMTTDGKWHDWTHGQANLDFMCMTVAPKDSETSEDGFVSEKNGCSHRCCMGEWDATNTHCNLKLNEGAALNIWHGLTPSHHNYKCYKDEMNRARGCSCVCNGGKYSPEGADLVLHATDNYVGCYKNQRWWRPHFQGKGQNVDITAQGLKQCREACIQNNYKYYSFECPGNRGGGDVHCQCGNDLTGTKADAETCSGGLKHAHCNGHFVQDGHHLGAAWHGSVYFVSDKARRQEARRLKKEAAARAKLASELAEAAKNNYVGCYRDQRWWRPSFSGKGQNVDITTEGLEQCRQACLAHGDKYYSFECPGHRGGGDVHCQCGSELTGTEKDAGQCSGDLKHGHCSGHFVQDGHHLGAAWHGSVYYVSDKVREAEEARLQKIREETEKLAEELEATAASKYVGCYKSQGWWRPSFPGKGQNVDISPQGIEECRQACIEHGYQYYAFECPGHRGGGDVHCQCGNDLTGRKVDEDTCSGGLNHAHCNGKDGSFIQNGHHLGAAWHGAVYMVNGDPMKDMGEKNCGGAHQRPCTTQWLVNDGCSKETSIAKPFNDNSCWPCGGNNQLACKYLYEDNQGCGPGDELAKGGDASKEHAIGIHHGYNEINPNPHPAGKCWICGGDNQPRCDTKYGNNNGCKYGHSGAHHANKCWSCERSNVNDPKCPPPRKNPSNSWDAWTGTNGGKNEQKSVARCENICKEWTKCNIGWGCQMGSWHWECRQATCSDLGY